MKNYKIEKTYWLVYNKDYDKLIEASEKYFNESNIYHFKQKYKDKLYFSYDYEFNFSCGPLTDIHFYVKNNYTFMGNFSLQMERKLKIEKLYENTMHK